jgi:hypothetical protein
MRNWVLVGLGEFQRTDGNGRKGPLFSMFSIIRLSVSGKIFFQANRIAGFGDLHCFLSYVQEP